jgi:hypothetical protein
MRSAATVAGATGVCAIADEPDAAAVTAPARKLRRVLLVMITAPKRDVRFPQISTAETIPNSSMAEHVRVS